VDSGANIVVISGQSQLARLGTAPNGIHGFNNANLRAGLRQSDGGGQPVWPGTNDQGVMVKS
jgi:hypothetical protein